MPPPPSIDETTHNSASPLLRRCLGRVAGAKRQPATARLRRGCMSASGLLSFRARIVICGTDPEFGCTFGHCLGEDKMGCLNSVDDLLEGVEKR